MECIILNILLPISIPNTACLATAATAQALSRTRAWGKCAVFAALVLASSLATGQTRPANLGTIRLEATDQDQRQLGSVHAELKDAAGAVVGKPRSASGHAIEFDSLLPGTYSVTVSSPGFETVTQESISVAPSKTEEIVLVLRPATEKQQVDVAAVAENIPATSSSVAGLDRDEVNHLPSHPATVADALPLVPGVVRAPDGAVEIFGANETQSSLLVNNADVTDPATGQFGPTVPVDSVESIEVAKTPYLAQYGGFTAGVVSVATRRGGDKWHFELNDPLPEFRIRSLHLRGIKSVSPRFTFNGPLIKNRLFLAESIDYSLSKSSVLTLAFPYNENKKTSVNSFSQLDLVVSPKHIMTATFHVVPSRARFENLNFFNPQPVTPSLVSHDYGATVIDRLETRFGLLQSTVNVRRAEARIMGQGAENMVLTPRGNRGNYFGRQNRRAERFDWMENLQFPAFKFHGAHTLQAGLSAGYSVDKGIFRPRTTDVTGVSGELLKRIEFTGTGRFNRNDWETSSFLQDHWAFNDRFSVDLGARWERQDITQTNRVAPRAGFSWRPFRGQSTTVRGGAGLFYDRVPLNIYAFNFYPQQIITKFDPLGTALGGPRKFTNLTRGRRRARFAPPVSLENTNYFSPSAVAWSMEIEHPLSNLLLVRASYLHRDGSGLITLAPALVAGRDALVLGSGGRSQYRQLEFDARLSLKKERRLYFSYAHSMSRGDLTDAAAFLGNFPQPVVHATQFTNTEASVPNRLLVWGDFALPMKFRVSPLLESRTGFPYAVRNVLQEYAGTPYSDKTRFPTFLSVDASLAKDFQITQAHAVRVQLRGLNLTNHFNALAVHANNADPKFGQFFGNYSRRFRLDFDFLF